MAKTAYRKLKLPKADWVVLVGEGGDIGPYKVSNFGQVEGGITVCYTDGRPLILRVTEQKGDEITSVDGGGKAYRYRIRPVAVSE